MAETYQEGKREGIREGIRATLSREGFSEAQIDLRLAVIELNCAEWKKTMIYDFVVKFPEKRENGLYVLDTEDLGGYPKELKVLFQKGGKLCTGLVVTKAAQFRGQRPILIDQLIEHAKETRAIGKMVALLEIDFGTKGAPWPQLLVESWSSQIAHQMSIGYDNDKAVFKLINEHSNDQIEVEVRYHPGEQFTRMHRFSIRRV